MWGGEWGFHVAKTITIWLFNIANWKITIFNGKIHYKIAIFNSYVKLPEDTIWLFNIAMENPLNMEV